MSRAVAIADIPAGRLRTAALAAYAAQVEAEASAEVGGAVRTPAPATGPNKAARARRGVSSARGRVRCGTCGAEFDEYGAAAERHADEHGGARIELEVSREAP